MGAGGAEPPPPRAPLTLTTENNQFSYSVDVPVSIRDLHVMKVSDRDRNIIKVRKLVLF